MKNLSYFIAGVLFVILISATTVSVMTVKPATPKATVVIGEYGAKNLNTKIKPYLKAGYVVKNIGAGHGYSAVVLEKY